MHWSYFTCSNFPHLVSLSRNLGWESDEQTSNQLGQGVEITCQNRDTGSVKDKLEDT